MNEPTVETQTKQTPARMPVLCDACGKSMTNPETGASTIGMMFNFQTGVASPTDDKFMAAQLEPYQMDRKYCICYSCWMRAFYITP